MEACVQDTQNVGMVQFLEDLRLLDKLLTLFRSTKGGVEDFDSNNGIVLENDVFRLVYRAKGTAIDFANQAVVAKVFPDPTALVYHAVASRFPHSVEEMTIW
jgi:hypothetical protein